MKYFVEAKMLENKDFIITTEQEFNENRSLKRRIIISSVMVAIMLILFIAFGLFTKYTEIHINGDKNITIEYGEKDYSIPQAFATIPMSSKISKEEALEMFKNDPYKIGEQKAKYEFQFFLKRKTFEQTINIVDTTPPNIELTVKDGYTVSRADEYEEEGYKATDNVLGDITDKVKVDKNGEIITYSVEDKYGNKTEVQRKIPVFESNPPKITLKGSSSIELLQGEKYQDEGYTCVDDTDGDITDKVQVEGDIDFSKSGTYRIRYTCSDRFGNKSEKTRTIVISPIIDLSDTTVYLTFDDGPSSETKRLLDILNKYDVKATFFVTGRGDSSIFKDIVNNGHAIGAHTYTHNYNIYQNSDTYFADLNKILNLIKEKTGVETHLIRFPGGSSNTVSKKYSKGIMSRLTKEVTEKGYYYFDWNISSGDAGGTASTSTVISNIKKGISSYKNSVVLQHDTKSFSVDAVESVIRWGKACGCKFDILSETAPTTHHGVNN